MFIPWCHDPEHLQERWRPCSWTSVWWWGRWPATSSWWRRQHRRHRPWTTPAPRSTSLQVNLKLSQHNWVQVSKSDNQCSLWPRDGSTTKLVVYCWVWAGMKPDTDDEVIKNIDVIPLNQKYGDNNYEKIKFIICTFNRWCHEVQPIAWMYRSDTWYSRSSMDWVWSSLNSLKQFKMYIFSYSQQFMTHLPIVGWPTPARRGTRPKLKRRTNPNTVKICSMKRSVAGILNPSPGPPEGTLKENNGTFKQISLIFPP